MTTKKSKKRFQSVWTSQGELVEWVRGSTTTERGRERLAEQGFVLRDANNEFMATLNITAFARGGSGSDTFYLTDIANDRVYPMYPVDFFHMLKNADLYRGQITGVFTVVKHGRRQGIQLVREVVFDEDGKVIQEVDLAPLEESVHTVLSA